MNFTSLQIQFGIFFNDEDNKFLKNEIKNLNISVI